MNDSTGTLICTYPISNFEEAELKESDIDDVTFGISDLNSIANLKRFSPY
jgi:hypothetical protein